MQSDKSALQRIKESHGLSYAQLAAILGCSVGHAKKLGCGAALPSARMARRIVENFKGKVTLEELLMPRRRARAS